MHFISYHTSGFRHFIVLAIPVLVFFFFYLSWLKKYGRKIEQFHAYYLASQVIIVYVFIFFLYLFFGLRLLYIFNLWG